MCVVHNVTARVAAVSARMNLRSTRFGLNGLRSDVGGQHLGQFVVLEATLQKLIFCQVTVIVFIHSEFLNGTLIEVS